MKIYTSYFARIKQIRERDDLLPVSIARFKPNWLKEPVLEFKKLAPSVELLSDIKNGLIDEEQYIRRFKKEVLVGKTVEAVRIHLMSFAGNKDVVLLCYERPYEFCHRHIIREWFNNNGIYCEELQF